MKMRHPIDLLYRLRKVKYGMWDYKNNNVISLYDPEMAMDGYLDEHCRILRPNEVWEKKIGTCWDICLLAYEELGKLINITDMTGIYVEYTCESSGSLGTHAALAYVYRVNNNQALWYWFDHRHPVYGVNGPYFSKEELDCSFLRAHEYVFGNYDFYNPSFNPGEILSLPGDITTHDFIKIARGEDYDTNHG